MLRTVITVLAISEVVQSSDVHHVAPIASAPVVTASSSQYFERTFNRLVAPPVFVEPVLRQQFIPVQPIQTAPVQPGTHLQPVQHLQPVPLFQSVVPVQPMQPLQPAQPQPVEPNVSIAIATANAAAPIATILLPPYPFGFPPSFGFPQEQPKDDRTKEETTTQKPTTQADVKTTRESEATTQVPNGSDDNAVQAFPSNQDESQVNFRQYLGPSPLPSNQNVNFKQYAAPSPLPSNQNVNFRQYLGPSPLPSNQNVNFKQYAAPSPLPSNQNVNLRQYLGPNPQPQRTQHHQRLALPQPLPHHHHHHHPHKYLHVHPQKLKTLVEVQRVPLAYIAPPPLPHIEHNHQAIKIVKHIHSFVPSKAKLIIRPILKTRSISANTGYTAPALPLRSIAPPSQSSKPFNTKEIEPTTIRPFPLPNTKPPRL